MSHSLRAVFCPRCRAGFPRKGVQFDWLAMAEAGWVLRLDLMFCAGCHGVIVEENRRLFEQLSRPFAQR